MAGEALFLGWGPVVQGPRADVAFKVFQETIEYYGRLQQEGKIDSFEPVLIAPHGGRPRRLRTAARRARQAG